MSDPLNIKTDLGPLQISRVICGLWQVADMEKEGEDLDREFSSAALNPYTSAGITTFDMADHYGSSELIVGHHIRSGRDELQALTKWVPKPGKVTREETRQAVEKALDRLQSKRLDLLQYHAWNYADESYLDQLFWLQELKEEGLIRALGLTNFDAAHLRVVRASGIEVVSNQVSYSLIDQRAGRGLTATCKELGVKLLAYGTLAGGFISERWLNQEEPLEPSSWSLMKYKRFIDQAGGWNQFQELLSVVSDIAGKHGVSMANVATKYILEQPEVAGVIIGARLGEREHINDNLRLFEFELDDDDREAVGQKLASQRPIPGDCGDEYRKPPFLTASGDLSHHLESMPLPYEPQEARNGTKILSGTSWEDDYGYCRAIRRGNRILVSGTTASHGDRPIGGFDPEAQAHFVIDKIEGAIQSLGGTLEDVVRTRVFVHDMAHWEPVARAHGSRFREIKPVNTLVQAPLVGEQYLVEIEAEAVID